MSLQTSPQTGVVIRNTLRKGTDCHVATLLAMTGEGTDCHASLAITEPSPVSIIHTDIVNIPKFP